MCPQRQQPEPVLGSAAAAMHAAGCLDWIGQRYYDASVSLAAAKNNIDLAIAAGIPAAKIGVGCR